MRISIIILVALILVLTGCTGINNFKTENTSFEKLPDTLAFQDEFTREFMASTEEVEDGYYLFESRTGRYTMLFPINATIDQSFYQYGDKKEDIEINEYNEMENWTYFIRMEYFDRKSTNDVDFYLSLLSDMNGYDEDFEDYVMNNNEIYYGEMIHKVNEKKSGTFYVFLGYIKSKNSDKGIIFDYNVRCFDESKECKLDMDKERIKAKKMMESIKFS